MPASYVNGAPPKETPLSDARGRITAPWFSYLLNLQNAGAVSTAAAAAVGDIPHASASATGVLTSADWSTFNGKQPALGFTPLNPANNLSDLAAPATARGNLGLGSAATHAASDFDAVGAAAAAQAAAIASSLQRAANLSDLANAATARGNLGLGSAATQASSAFDAAGAGTAAAAALLASANTWNGATQTINSDVTIWGQLTIGYAINWNAAQIFGTAKFSNDMLFPFSNGFWYASPNASTWYEFRSITSQGAALANDYFGYQYNQRATSGGADVWRDVFQMAALTGAFSVFTAASFAAAVAFANSAAMSATGYLTVNGLVNGTGGGLSNATSYSISYYNFGMQMGPSFGLAWGAASAASGYDTGLGRSAAGVLEVNSGTAGTRRTLATGGLVTAIRAVTAADTATTSDHTILGNITSTVTETLPAAPLTGQEFYLVNVGSASWTISGNGKNIWTAGASAATIPLAANAAAILQYDGTLYRRIL